MPAEVASRLARHRLDEGDIVMGRKGDVGRAAVVSAASAGWLCGSDSIAIRTGPHLSSEFLGQLFQIGLYRQQLDSQSTRATLANVNEPTLLSMRIPALEAAEQERRYQLAVRSDGYRRSMGTALRRQINLLVERRQALITAAVTGELEIPGVAA